MNKGLSSEKFILDYFSPGKYAIMYIMKTEADELHEKILAAISKALANSGLTQEELAYRCSLSQPTIQRIMAGTRGRSIPLKTVLHIALSLDIDLAGLLRYEPQSRQEEIQTLLSKIGQLIANE